MATSKNSPPAYDISCTRSNYGARRETKTRSSDSTHLALPCRLALLRLFCISLLLKGSVAILLGNSTMHVRRILFHSHNFIDTLIDGAGKNGSHFDSSDSHLRGSISYSAATGNGISGVPLIGSHLPTSRWLSTPSQKDYFPC